MSSPEVMAFPLTVLQVPRPHDGTASYAANVAAGMTNNPNFNPAPPELAVLEADLALYQPAIVAARNKGSVEVKKRNALRRKVVIDLRHLRDRVQAAADGQASPADAATVIVGAGMHVKKVTKRNKPPVQARNGPVSGSVLLEALRVATVAMYWWEFSLDQKSWSAVPETMKASVVVSGLTPGQLYYFRFRAHTRKGPVDYSQIVSLIVH